MLTASSFDCLTVVELLQNIYDYLFVLTRKKYLYFEIYSKWNIERLFLKWPFYFPDIVYELERLEENDPFFRPGLNANAKRYYNTLLHYGK